MRALSNYKHRFFSAFREIFVHHHGSLEFRAKTFALVLAAYNNSIEHDHKAYEIIKDYALKIYKDEARADLLLITTKELVKKVYDKNGLDIDTLVAHIQKELKIVPRYAKKIDLEPLKEIISHTHDKDTLSYQENILEFLQNLKDEILKMKQEQIERSEASIISRYSSS